MQRKQLPLCWIGLVGIPAESAGFVEASDGVPTDSEPCRVRNQERGRSKIRGRREIRGRYEV